MGVPLTRPVGPFALIPKILINVLNLEMGKEAKTDNRVSLEDQEGVITGRVVKLIVRITNQSAVG